MRIQIPDDPSPNCMDIMAWAFTELMLAEGINNMYNDKSRENLKPFSSENQPERNGRPKGSSSLTNEIRKVLDGIDETSKKPIRELLAIAAAKQAMKGNSAYFKEIMERIDGKLTDKTEITGNDGKPIEIRVIYVEPGDEGRIK